MSQVIEDHIYIHTTAVGEPIVRAATDADVQAIVAVVNQHARQGHLLPRSADNIRASLPDWLVAEIDDALVGVGSLVEMSRALVEIRSLAVLPAYRRFGVGRMIVDGLAERARQRGFKTAFALTRAVPFFERLGFVVTDKEQFPEKVWKDCVVCPLQQCCDETAVVLEL
jgi:amino-acid N-acetyltransferase